MYEDFFSIIINVRKDLPLFIFAHSMGGGTITALLKRNPSLKIAGVIISNPFIKLESHGAIEISSMEKFMI